LPKRKLAFAKKEIILCQKGNSFFDIKKYEAKSNKKYEAERDIVKKNDYICKKNSNHNTWEIIQFKPSS
jgi:hypothetical protein